MQWYFVDAWYLIALANRFDSHHSAARRLKAFVARHKLITHDAVLMEVLAYFSGFGAHSRQNAAISARRAHHEFRVEPATRDLFQRGLDLYEARLDKEYSVVDCMSMSLMRQRGVTHVLTNDHHFSQEGFVVLSDAP